MWLPAVRSIAWLGLRGVMMIDGQSAMPTAIPKKNGVKSQHKKEILVAPRAAKRTQPEIGDAHKSSRPQYEDNVRPAGQGHMKHNIGYNADKTHSGESYPGKPVYNTPGPKGPPNFGVISFEGLLVHLRPNENKMTDPAAAGFAPSHG